jgi:hypothetical protein
LLIDVVGELFLNGDKGLNPQRAALFQNGGETERPNGASRPDDFRTDGTGGRGDRRSGGSFLGGGRWGWRWGLRWRLLAQRLGKWEKKEWEKKQEDSAEATP